MGFFDRISQGLQRSRDKFKEEMNVLLDRGPDLDEEFWDGLEETLILADIGGAAACDIVERLREQATRKALPDAYAVLDMLNDQIAETFTEGGQEILDGDPACVLFVGINGTGKTTTVGKLSKEATRRRPQGHLGQRRHVPRRGHRAAGGVGAPRRRGDGHARARCRPGQRVLRHARARRGRRRRSGAHRHGRAPAHVGRPHARARRKW